MGIDNCSGAWYKGLKSPWPWSFSNNFSLVRLEKKHSENNFWKTFIKFSKPSRMRKKPAEAQAKPSMRAPSRSLHAFSCTPDRYAAVMRRMSRAPPPARNSKQKGKMRTSSKQFKIYSYGNNVKTTLACYL